MSHKTNSIVRSALSAPSLVSRAPRGSKAFRDLFTTMGSFATKASMSQIAKPRSQTWFDAALSLQGQGSDTGSLFSEDGKMLSRRIHAFESKPGSFFSGSFHSSCTRSGGFNKTENEADETATQGPTTTSSKGPEQGKILGEIREDGSIQSD